MLCQQCGKNPATTHVQRNVNGSRAEYFLCSNCASTLQLTSFGLGGFLENFFMEPAAPSAMQSARCQGCGYSFDEIARMGKVGCAQCYDTFYQQLLPSLQRLHGKPKHEGRVPSGSSAQAKEANALQELQVKLKEAIDRQAFEEAAKLRDEIKAREEKPE